MNQACFATIGVLFTLPVTALAQVPRDSTHYPPRAQYPHSVAILAPYDSDQNKTVLQTAPFSLTSSLSISVLSALDGKVVVTPAPNVVFTFWSTAPGGLYASNTRVLALLNDTDTLDLGKAWLTPNPRPGYTEVLLKGALLGQFLSIVNSKTVVLSIGPTTQRLTDTQLAILRDFASRMAPVRH